jgi:hypothetical protein
MAQKIQEKLFVSSTVILDEQWRVVGIYQSAGA